MRNIELAFGHSEMRWSVTMHWDEAPQTCAAMWNMLDAPFTAPTNHAVFSGYEVYSYCSPVDLPLENHVVFPKPGQLIYYFLPARRNASNIAHRINLNGHTADAAEIALWYGEGDLRRVTETGVRGNHFATVDRADETLFEAGYRLLTEGRSTMTLRRAER